MTQQEIVRLAREIAETASMRLGSNGQPPLSGESGCTVCDVPAAEGVAAPREDHTGPSSPAWTPPKEGIAGLIDHTLLRQDAVELEVVRLCAEARRHAFRAVCVHPCRVAAAARELSGAPTTVCTVIGFPHGAQTTPIKCMEAEQVLKLGAGELDMVIDLGALKSGSLDSVYTEIRSVAELAHQAGAELKVILEMACLNESHKIQGAVLAKLAGADFVKTSTGFGPGGADSADVALLHRVVGGEMGIKAAGGVRTLTRFKEMMAAGATRIGSSAGVEILKQFHTALGSPEATH